VVEWELSSAGLLWRDILLATQIALCALLLTAALVAFRGMQRSLHAPLGFQPDGVVSAETDLHMAGYTDQSSLVVQKRMFGAGVTHPWPDSDRIHQRAAAQYGRKR